MMRVHIATLLIISLISIWSLYRAHRDPTFALNLFDLIMENGRVSKLAFAFMVGLFVLSWIMVTLTLEHRMTEGYIGLYGAIIIAPVISKLFSPSPGAGTTTDTTDIIKTTVRTVAPTQHDG